MPILGIIASSRPSALTAFTAIATVTAAGGETSLTFSSIPATYTDLQIRGIYRDTEAGNYATTMRVGFNADTGNNYSHHNLQGDGSSAQAEGVAATGFIRIREVGVGDTATASAFGAVILDISNYANTSKNTTLRGFSGTETNVASSSFRVSLSSGAWYNTAAVTSVKLTPATAFKAGTTFALYGIKGAA